MPKAVDLKKGHVIELNGQLLLAKQVDVQSPSSRSGNTLYKARFTNLQTGQKVEQSFTGDEVLHVVELLRRQVQFLFREGQSFTFMDIEDYNQYSLDEDDIADIVDYLLDGLEGLTALIVDEKVIAIELPASIEMEIIDTSPAIKGASASARTKPATTASGLVVQVPEYLAPGERIKINTENGKFMSRA